MYDMKRVLYKYFIIIIAMKTVKLNINTYHIINVITVLTNEKRALSQK